MARLTVSYSIAFIPGLPRPLVLSEVIDDVIGLSTFSSRHTVRKAPGTPDRLDVVVPVDDLEGALDSAAQVADELTRIGESLLGLGFVVEERAIRIEGLTDNWLPDTFDGAGSRHHASTDLDAAAPLPDHLDEPVGDVPDEELRLDRLTHLPAADEPPRFGHGEPGREDEDARFTRLPGGEGREEPIPDEADGADACGDPRGADPFSVDPLGTRALRVVPEVASDDAGRSAAEVLPPAQAARPPVHRDEPLAVVRRRDLARALAAPSAPSRGVWPRSGAPRAGASPARAPHAGASLAAFGLFALALVTVVAPWRLSVSAWSIVALAFAAAAFAAGATALWPATRHRGGMARTAVLGTATLAIVLAFASGFAICARDGHLAGAGGRPPTVGESLSAAVSLGTAPELRLGAGARSIAYGERLLLLLFVVGVGAQATTRTGRPRA